MKRILHLIVVVAFVAVAFAQQDPASEVRAEEAEGVIVGKVVSSKTGEPLANTYVKLSNNENPGSSSARVANTAADGSFAFRQLPLGSYTLEPEKAGFNPLPSRDTRIKLGPKETRMGVIVRMTPFSAVTGRVVDTFGDPVPEARVIVRLPMFGVNWVGWPVDAQTNDRGEYRIANLPPVKFVIGIEPPEAPSQRGVGVRESASSFYPGVERPEQAARLKLAPGEERLGIDFRLEPAPETSIEGTMIDGPTGRPCDRCSIHFVDSTNVWGPGTSTTPGGLFVLRGMTPGPGLLQVRGARAMQSTGEKVTVTESGATQAMVILGRGHKVSGEVVLDDPPKKDKRADSEEQDTAHQQRAKPRTTVTLAPEIYLLDPNLESSVPEKGGPFEISNVRPGLYKVRLDTMNVDPSNAGYVRAVTIDGRELSAPEITMPDADLFGLKIHVAFDGAALSGTVKMSEKDGISPWVRPEVVLMPDDESNPYRYHHMVRVESETGEFSQGGIPPGRYTVYAIPDMGFNLRDPEVRAALEPIAKKITLSKSENAAIELTLASELP